MKVYDYKIISEKKIRSLFSRPSIETERIFEQVNPILADIKKNRNEAVIRYAKLFDNFNKTRLLVSINDLNSAAQAINPALKKAIDIAAKNIQKFHKLQVRKDYSLETMPGIFCERKILPIENVGLYIPGGSALLFSTMLMLGIPAKLAGCRRIVVCSPLKNEIHPALAYSAKICGINEFYNIGGVQAVAMMAYGTESCDKVDKIFGPGNQYVTAAKSLISIDPDGCLIDMPAGPSEVLVIADNDADPSFIASDLLAQAEHGSDSQVILITTSKELALKVLTELKSQVDELPRKNIVMKSLRSSFILIVQSIREAINLSNRYAPEHLILNVQNYSRYISKIKNAGSIFLGEYSPESIGDYASGTNHSLPTYGYAKTIGGVTVDSFTKSITIQKLSKKGFQSISETVIQMAEEEKLEAHANAIKVRLKK
jgi:histidinol dehydrogenase